MQESTNMNIVSAFVHEWAICAGAESVLHFKASTFKNIFPSLHNLKTQEVDAAQNIPKDSSYDLILGDLPIGMNQVEWNDGTKTITAQRNWMEILKSLTSLEANGTALFLLEPLGFNSSKGIVLRRNLMNAVFLLMPSSIVLKEYFSRKRR